MNNRKKRFVKRGIIIPLVISLLVTTLFFIVYGALVGGVFFSDRDFRLAEYQPAEVKEAEMLEGGSPAVSINELAPVDSNTVIGNAKIIDKSMPVIFNPNDVNSGGRLSIDSDGGMIGDRGCAYLFCNKRDAATFRMLEKSDIIEFDMYYGSFTYKVVDIITVTDDISLYNAADKYGKAVAVYTDASVGVGVSDAYYVVIGEFVSGTEITQ